MNDLENKHNILEDPEVADMIAHVDKESRIRKLKGAPGIVASALCILFAVFGFMINSVILLNLQINRAAFLGCVVCIGFILYPPTKGSRRDVVPWYDILLALISAAAYFYLVINFDTIVKQAGSYTDMNVFVAIVALLCLFELCRRAIGLPILIIAIVFIVYALFGGLIPGFFGNRGFTFQRVAIQLYYTTEGIFGTPLGVCATFIFLFILLGAFLEKTGVGKFFIDISNSIAGWATGGPAKVAVIASALQGMISGSSVANTVGSGSFTIPMMKKMGYKADFAAAVEAAASTGGQIMPPIMGAAAFLMAEVTGIQYSSIVAASIIPAVLYFTGVALMVHFEAKKLGLMGIPRAELPKFWDLMLKRGYLLIPMLVIIGCLIIGFTPSRAALFSIISALLVSFFSKETRITPAKFFSALEKSTHNIVGIAVACAVSGIIVGMVTLTGVGVKLASGLLSISGGVVILALFLTMIACLILGMGAPTTATYVIMAAITAPIVVQLGVPVLAAHLFVFYFGIVADITPPVALAAYAGSAISGSKPLKTGVTATRLAITAFIIPYIFCLSPQMLMIDATIGEVILVVATAILGMVGISSGMERFLLHKTNLFETLLLIGGGLTLIIPGLVTDVIGFALIALAFVLQYTKRNRLRNT